MSDTPDASQNKIVADFDVDTEDYLGLDDVHFDFDDEESRPPSPIARPVAVSQDDFETYDIEVPSTESMSLDDVVIALEAPDNVEPNQMRDVLSYALMLLNSSDVRFVVKALSTPFLTNLLGQRRRVRLLHNDPLSSQNENPGIVTWIDAFLVALSNATIRLATTSFQHAPDPRTSDYTPFQRDDVLVAACQLPNDWSQFPRWLVSNHVTAISRKMALTLLFGVFVLAPDICDSDFTPLDKRMAHETQRCLHMFMRKAVESEWGTYGPDEIALQPLTYSTPLERIEFALALNTYATIAQTNMTDIKPDYQPRTISDCAVLLMTLVQGIFDQQASPADTIPTDLAQCALLQWGQFVPWAWSSWPPDHVHYDLIVLISAIWLQLLPHVSLPSSKVRKRENIADVLASHPTEAIHIISLIAQSISWSNPDSLLSRSLSSAMKHSILRLSLLSSTLLFRKFQDPLFVTNTSNLIRPVCQVVFDSTLSRIRTGEFDWEDRAIIVSFLTSVYQVYGYAGLAPLDNTTVDTITDTLLEQVKPSDIVPSFETPTLRPEDRPRLLDIISLVDILVILFSNAPSIPSRFRATKTLPSLFEFIRELSPTHSDPQASLHVIMLSTSSIALLSLCLLPDPQRRASQSIITRTTLATARNIFIHCCRLDPFMLMAAIQLIQAETVICATSNQTASNSANSTGSGAEAIVQWNYMRNALITVLVPGISAAAEDALQQKILLRPLCEAMVSRLSVLTQGHLSIVLRSPWTTSLLQKLRTELASTSPTHPESLKILIEKISSLRSSGAILCNSTPKPPILDDPPTLLVLGNSPSSLRLVFTR